jgi:hypothetical protein
MVQHGMTWHIIDIICMEWNKRRMHDMISYNTCLNIKIVCLDNWL